MPNSLTLPPEHPVFRRVASSGHADLLTVERGIDPKRKRERTEIVAGRVQFLGAPPADDTVVTTAGETMPAADDVPF